MIAGSSNQGSGKEAWQSKAHHVTKAIIVAHNQSAQAIQRPQHTTTHLVHHVHAKQIKVYHAFSLHYYGTDEQLGHHGHPSHGPLPPDSH